MVSCPVRQQKKILNGKFHATKLMVTVMKMNLKSRPALEAVMTMNLRSRAALRTKVLVKKARLLRRKLEVMKVIVSMMRSKSHKSLPNLT